MPCLYKCEHFNAFIIRFVLKKCVLTRWQTAVQYTHASTKRKKKMLLLSSFQMKMSNQDTVGCNLSVEKMWTQVHLIYLFVKNTSRKIFKQAK